MRDESSVSNADVPVIPSQLKVTHQILSHWEPFRDLKARFAGSRRAEQFRFAITAADSIDRRGLRTSDRNDWS